MNINVLYDKSAESAPSAFKNDVQSVVDYFNNKFIDQVTINLHVGYGKIGEGQSFEEKVTGGTLGENHYSFVNTTYEDLVHALQKNSALLNPVQHQAAESLPLYSVPVTGGPLIGDTLHMEPLTHVSIGDPTPPSSHFAIGQSEAVALGLMPSNTVVEAYMGFNADDDKFDFDRTDGITDGMVDGKVVKHYDFQGVVAHEVSEVMGRHLEVGHDGNYSLMDLFHYSAPGVRDFSGTTPGYFSIDNGLTKLGNFNTNKGWDPGDWTASDGPDAFNTGTEPGMVNDVTPNDIKVMEALGWHLSQPAVQVSYHPLSPFLNGDVAGVSHDMHSPSLSLAHVVQHIPDLI